MHQIRHGKKNKSMQLGQHRPSASLALNRRKRAACARAVDEARTWALQEERTEAWWHALRRIETTSSEVSGTTPPWCGLKFGDGNKKRLAGFTGLARGEKKEHKKKSATKDSSCLVHSAQEPGAQIKDVVTGRETPKSQRRSTGRPRAGLQQKQKSETGRWRQKESD
jgi:hypothetical protein